MKIEEIKAIQEKIGVKADGQFGPISFAALRAYLRSLMPSPNPWPAQDQQSLQAFYGSPGDEGQLVKITFPYVLRYDGAPVQTTRCHKKVAQSLLRVLIAIRDKHSGNQAVMHAVTDFAGVYANRAMRGGTNPSLHARGAAIDLSAGSNGNQTPWPSVADMPLEIMEEFAREGWLSAGAFWARDGMHFQSTQ